MPSDDIFYDDAFATPLLAPMGTAFEVPEVQLSTTNPFSTPDAWAGPQFPSAAFSAPGLSSLAPTALPANIQAAIDNNRAFNSAQSALVKSYLSDGYTAAEVKSLIEGYYYQSDLLLWETYASGNYYDPFLYNVVVAKTDKGGGISFNGTPELPFYNDGDENLVLVVGSAGNDSLTLTNSNVQPLGDGADILFSSNGGVDSINASALSKYEILQIADGAAHVNVKMASTGLLKIDDVQAFSGAITSFGLGNAIDLANIGLMTSYTLSAKGVLTVTNGSNSYSITLSNASSYSNDKFELRADSSGDGTEIILTPRASKVITFSEYAVGTVITNQYKSYGVIFTSHPLIVGDNADPTSPALAANTQYNGPIAGYFCDPNTGSHATVNEFEFDAGYFNNIGSTEIEWFGKKGQLLGKLYDESYGYQHFSISSATPIANFLIKEIGKEVSGYSFDNLVVGKVTG
jgi:hypothetical protein